jgi:hypothetical protein
MKMGGSCLGMKELRIREAKDKIRGRRPKIIDSRHQNKDTRTNRSEIRAEGQDGGKYARTVGARVAIEESRHGRPIVDEMG